MKSTRVVLVTQISEKDLPLVQDVINCTGIGQSLINARNALKEHEEYSIYTAAPYLNIYNSKDRLLLFVWEY